MKAERQCESRKGFPPKDILRGRSNFWLKGSSAALAALWLLLSRLVTTPELEEQPQVARPGGVSAVRRIVEIPGARGAPRTHEPSISVPFGNSQGFCPW